MIVDRDCAPITAIQAGTRAVAGNWPAMTLWGLSQNWQSSLAWKAQVGAVPFFIGMALLPLVGVPSTPLFVLAGVTFGLGTALAGSALAVLANRGEFFVDDNIAMPIVDRLIHHSHVFMLGGESYRLKQKLPN